MGGEDSVESVAAETIALRFAQWEEAMGEETVGGKEAVQDG